VYYDKAELGRLLTVIPSTEPVPADVIAQVLYASQASGANMTAMAGLNRAHDAIWSAYLRELGQGQTAFAKHLRSQGQELQRLNQPVYYDKAELGRLLTVIPSTEPVPADVIAQVLYASQASGANMTAMAGLDRAHDAIWNGHLRELGQSQMAFWESRVRELCGNQYRLPVSPSHLQDQAAPADWLRYLRELDDYRKKIWELYIECQEPKTVIINEELLHFRVNRFDDFESDPTPGLKKILDYVDTNRRTHGHIYVIGHTDDQADHRYNDHLSYRRALYVVDKVRAHLQSQQLVEGKDYTLYPLGMGEYQLLTRGTTESLDDWRKRCRRIELSFRSDFRDRQVLGRAW
jgi:outer membrane protein OmpA-like peptidoglycan-associated protein